MINKILNAKYYYEIFSKEHYKQEYSKLILQFHPDKNKSKEARQITVKLNQLYTDAKIAIQNNNWGEKSTKQSINIKVGDKTYQIKYRYMCPTEIGSMYIGDNILAFTFNQEKFYNNYIQSVNIIKYNDDKMKQYFQQFLPKIKQTFKANDNTYYVILEKDKEVYPLTLVKDIFTAKEHAAWVTTRLLNLCILFSCNNFVHCGITLNNCFVNLNNHGLYLFGGWHFGTQSGQKMIGASREIFENLPPLIKDTKIANYSIDVNATKSLIQKLLNANSYQQLKKICGEDMAIFLNHISSQPLEELKDWELVRSKVFPEHKFIKIKNMKPDDVFKD